NCQCSGNTLAHPSRVATLEVIEQKGKELIIVLSATDEIPHGSHRRTGSIPRRDQRTLRLLPFTRSCFERTRCLLLPCDVFRVATQSLQELRRRLAPRSPSRLLLHQTQAEVSVSDVRMPVGIRGARPRNLDSVSLPATGVSRRSPAPPES